MVIRRGRLLSLMADESSTPSASSIYACIKSRFLCNYWTNWADTPAKKTMDQICQIREVNNKDENG